MTRAELLEQIAAARSNRFRGDELATAQRLEREVDALLAQLAQLDAPEPAQRSLF